jgi:CBS domain containing-hemolysin-like protein
MNRFGMKTIGKFSPTWMRSAVKDLAAGALPILLVMQPVPAQASMFKGETLDAVANVIAWVVLLIVPIVGIAAFWLVHILPEKIAEKKHHPQAKAIQTLCLLSLAFGGLLWPLAWLWAYTKPVFYKMAYGTDKEAHGHEGADVMPKEEGSEESKQTR